MVQSSSPQQPPASSSSLLGEFYRFLRHPVYTVNSPRQHQPLVDTLRLYALALLLVIPLVIVAGLVAAKVSSGHALTEMSRTVPLWVMFVFAVVFAPLSEETIFRLPLRYTPINVLLPTGIGLFVVLSTLVGANLIPKLLLLPLLGFVVCGCVLLYQWLQKASSKPIHNLYEKVIGWLFYGSAISFGLVHIANFQNFDAQAWLMAPLLVLPQTVLGVFFAFIRLQYGFWWCVLVHAFHNFLFIGPFVLSLMVSPTAIQVEASTMTTQDYLIQGLFLVFGVVLILLCIVTVWKMVIEWRAERHQTRMSG